MPLRTFAAFFFLSMAPALVFAGTAVIDSGEDGSQQIHLEYSGTNMIRMNLSEQAGAYMLLRDGKAYSVFEQDQEIMVIDMASIGSIRGLLGNLSTRQNMLGEEDIYELISFENTGRDEIVAGVKGEVYEITFIDGNGDMSTESMVLSSDVRAREMTTAFMSVSESMSLALQLKQPEGYEKLQEAMSNKGLLRYGANFRVAYFEPGEPEPSRFVLPAQPQTFDLGNMLESIEQTNGDAAREEKGSLLGNIFGNQAERQQNRVEDQSEQKVDQGIDRSVDKAVDKVFKGIFGR